MKKSKLVELIKYELEKRGKLSAVITQNVDGLYQKAGSNNVIELHGTAKEFYCFSCGKKLHWKFINVFKISKHQRNINANG